MIVRSTQVMLHVLHASQCSCMLHVSLQPSFAREKAYNEKAPQQNVIKCVDMKKTVFCQVFTYPYSRWHFYWTDWMPNTIMAQGLDSTGTNNLTRLVAQCAHVLYHKAQLRDLNWSTSTSFSIPDTMLSLHN